MNKRLEQLKTEDCERVMETAQVARMQTVETAPEIDLIKRTVRSVVMTDSLASDGGIMLPEGMALDRFKSNPVVRARHGMSESSRSPTIGRAISLDVTAHEVIAVTQFAETELGREYGYLYGLNPNKEVFQRAWSVDAIIFEKGVMSAERAKTLLAVKIEMDRLPEIVRKSGSVWIGIRSELLSFAAVEVGADRGALSRAFGDGVRLAGEIMARMDFQEATTELAALKQTTTQLDERCARLEKEIEALRSDGAAAAARGDSAAILSEIRAMREAVRS